MSITKAEDMVPNSSHLEYDEKPATSVSSKKEDDELPSDVEFRRVERSLVRKLDYTLMPMVWLLYFFNYLDRNNISYVKCLGPACTLFSTRRERKNERPVPSVVILSELT